MTGTDTDVVESIIAEGRNPYALNCIEKTELYCAIEKWLGDEDIPLSRGKFDKLTKPARIAAITALERILTKRESTL